MIYKIEKQHNAPDFKEVNNSSFVLDMNMLATYCRMSSIIALQDH